MMSGMAERAVIEASDACRTRASLATDLRSLGRDARQRAPRSYRGVPAGLGVWGGVAV